MVISPIAIGQANWTEMELPVSITKKQDLYTDALLRAAFAQLQLIELREYEAELQEGMQHSGKSALVGLVARKRMPAPCAT